MISGQICCPDPDENRVAVGSGDACCAGVPYDSSGPQICCAGKMMLSRLLSIVACYHGVYANQIFIIYKCIFRNLQELLFQFI